MSPAAWFSFCTGCKMATSKFATFKHGHLLTKYGKHVVFQNCKILNLQLERSLSHTLPLLKWVTANFFANPRSKCHHPKAYQRQSIIATMRNQRVPSCWKCRIPVIRFLIPVMRITYSSTGITAIRLYKQRLARSRGRTRSFLVIF